MTILINTLIIFFIILILYQLVLETKVIEGLTTQYEDYSTTDLSNTSALAIQNANNIQYLAEQMNNGSTIFQDLSGNVQTLQTQVNGLVQAQQQYASQIPAPQITGLSNDTNT